MKKIHLLVVAFLAPLALAGCVGQNTSRSSSANVASRRVVALTTDNFWYYFDTEQGKTSRGDSSDVFWFSLKGVLGFALYERVRAEVDMIYYDPAQGGDESTYSHYYEWLPLNAGGEGRFSWPFNGLPDGHANWVTDFTKCHVKFEVSNIAGDVIYTI
jgi:hypothetical protein